MIRDRQRELWRTAGSTAESAGGEIGTPVPAGGVPPGVPGMFAQARASGQRARRTPTRSTLVQLALLLPVALFAALVVGPLAVLLQRQFPPLGAATLLAAWWTPAALMFWRPAQRVVAGAWFGCRDPDATEKVRLELPWRAFAPPRTLNDISAIGARYLGVLETAGGRILYTSTDCHTWTELSWS